VKVSLGSIFSLSFDSCIISLTSLDMFMNVVFWFCRPLINSWQKDLDANTILLKSMTVSSSLGVSFIIFIIFWAVSLCLKVSVFTTSYRFIFIFFAL